MKKNMKYFTEEIQEWQVILIYGSFSVPFPVKNVNFIVVRIPAGKAPWAKKIVPALNRLIKPWYHIEDIKSDQIRHRTLYPEKKCEWYVDWSVGPETWNTKLTRKFEWNGKEIKEII